MERKDDQVKGPGLWKMNCFILEEESYINEVTQKVPIWVDEGQKGLADNQATWEWIKYNIRAHAIQFSKRRAKEKSDKEKCLQNEYTLASKLYKSDPCDANANLFHAAKEKLELFYEEKTKGIIIRAQARWYEHGEKSTKYFLNVEKRNHIKKHMRKLIINESVTTDSLTILSEQKLFYQNLYMSGRNETDHRNAAKSFLNNLNIPKLSEEEKGSCEGIILLNECELILETFQNNKAPGNDSIPVEFYKKLWPIISEPFIKYVNECFENKELSSSQKQAVITLIEKI